MSSRIVTPDIRAKAVLEAVGAAAAGSASGRYRHSEPILPGVRYWSSSQPRLRRDLLGIQFYGAQGLARAAAVKDRLEKSGFARRTPQSSQLTFAKLVPFGPADRLDLTALKSTKAEVDSIISSASDAGAAGSFRRFMLASPLADVDLPLPDRRGSWRDSAL